MKKTCLILVLLVLIIGVSLFADWGNEIKLLASDGAADHYFGYSVSIFGDYAVIGAPYDDYAGEESCSAYIYHYNGTNWLEQEKLTASDGVVDNLFGNTVSISGDYALIGAPFDDDNGEDSGSTYIYYHNGTSWEEQPKLTASDGAEYNYFGYAVSISGEYAVIGSYNDDNGGSAYIYHYNGTSWEEQQKLTASDGSMGDHFGRVVSISDSFIVIGAYRDDDNGEDSGSAYIYHYNGTSWIEQQKLTASDGAEDDRFGRAVSISNDYTVIGANGDDDNGEYSGSAYIYQYNGTSWTEQQKLTASDGAELDLFGAAVSIFEDYVVIGAKNDDCNGDDSGSAYIYQYNGTSWIEQQKLTASDGAEEDRFGLAVSLSGDYVLIGVSGDDDNGTFSGSAYIYENDGLSSEEEAISYPAVSLMNYPNPFNPETTISFEVEEFSDVLIEVYNIKGQRVEELVRGSFEAGSHQVVWKAGNKSSGVYFIRYKADEFEQVRKVMLVK